MAKDAAAARYLANREDLTPTCRGRRARGTRRPIGNFDQGTGPLSRGSGAGGGGGSSIVETPNSRFQIRSRAVN